MNPWFWAIGGLALGLVEIFAPGFYLIWLAVAALLIGLIGAVLDVTFETQLVLFAVLALVVCFGGYFVYRAMGRGRASGAELNDPSARLVGLHGTVAEPIVKGIGKIRLGDSVWLAEGPDLPPGVAVRVVAVRGTTAVVTEI